MLDQDKQDELLRSDVPWYTLGHLRKLNFIIVSLVLFSSTIGYDGSVMGGLYALPSWFTFMNKPAGTYLGWINACYFLANGLFFPVGAWVSGRYGRKKSVYVGYVLLAAGIALQSAAPNEKTFTYARMIIGAASAFISVAAPVIISEIAFPSHRSVASALYMCGYYVGGTLSGWVTFGTRVIDSDWAWRIPIILQIACPLVALTGFIMSPESPRWLISVGKIDQARQIIAEYHAGGNHDDPIVAYQMTEIQATIQAEKEASASTSYLDMTKTPGNRRRLLISISLGIFSQWAGNGVVSYYLPLMLRTIGIKTVTEQTLISACLNVWNLLWAVAAACCVDRLGRRFLFLSSASIMLVSFIVITGLSGSFATSPVPAVGLSVIPFIFIFFAGYDIALTPFLTAYPCEIWTFSLRSKGLTVTWISAFAGSFFNTFVNAIALEAIGWKYYFVFIAVLVVMWVTVWFFYPETRGHTLEQVAVIFDGDSAAVPPSEQIREKIEVVSKHEAL